MPGEFNVYATRLEPLPWQRELGIEFGDICRRGLEEFSGVESAGFRSFGNRGWCYRCGRLRASS